MTAEELAEIINSATGGDVANMLRHRPYDGQPHTYTSTRGATLIAGITYRDMRDAFIRAACSASGVPYMQDEAAKGEHAALCENDLYDLPWSKMDPGAVIQNLGCEIERLMGIFPNVPPLVYVGDPASAPPSEAS